MARQDTKTKETVKAYNRDMLSQWRPWGGGPWTVERHPLTLRPRDWVTYGRNLPLWWLNILLGKSATTTLSGVKHLSKSNPMHFDFYGAQGTPMEGFGRNGYGHNQSVSFPSPPAASVDSVAESRAASKFLADYKKATQTWSGGGFVAEFAETLRFLANPIGNLYRHTFDFVGRVGRLKKVYKRDPVRYGKLLGGAWLTYSFGIAPLVEDVNDAYDAFKKLADDLGAKDTIRIIGSGTNRVLEMIQNPTVPYTSYATFELTQFAEYEVKYLGACVTRARGAPEIARNFGVGFEDILPSVWEAVPWSWLVDYFVNFNEILDSVRLMTAEFAWVNRTVRNRRVLHASAIRPNISALDASWGLRGTASGGQAFYQSSVVNRVPTSVPYPSWQFRVPGLPRQFANVAALVSSIAASKPTR